jgi:hypothetical protein
MAPVKLSDLILPSREKQPIRLDRLLIVTSDGEGTDAATHLGGLCRGISEASPKNLKPAQPV